MNELVLVKTNLFKKEGMEADKNGMNNVFLEPIAGKMPNQAMVVAGTVAESNGLVAGNLQLRHLFDFTGAHPADTGDREIFVVAVAGDMHSHLRGRFNDARTGGYRYRLAVDR